MDSAVIMCYRHLVCWQSPDSPPILDFRGLAMCYVMDFFSQFEEWLAKAEICEQDQAKTNSRAINVETKSPFDHLTKAFFHGNATA